MRVVPFGDAAVLVELEQRVDPELISHARAIAARWEAQGLGHGVPAYASALLRFDPRALAPADALARARDCAAPPHADAAGSPGRLIEIPTRYDGPDLAAVCESSGLAPEELVALHSGREYTAFFLGFMPGFAYCGPLDPRIRALRRDSPRARVPAGSVAVADGQTAVYPFASPGGWQLIGSTTLRPFDAQADPPVRIAAGDRVRFVRL